MTGVLGGRFVPMNVPAALHRAARRNAVGLVEGNDPIIVARGPLIIMAHGLMTIDPLQRDAFRITSPVGDFSAQETAELLYQWRTPQARETGRNRA